VQGLNLFNQIALIYAFCVICMLVIQAAPLELIVFMCLIFYKQNTPTKLYLYIVCFCLFYEIWNISCLRFSRLSVIQDG